MKKIVVRYIGGVIGEPSNNEVWGGTMATNYAIREAFKCSEIFDLQMKMRRDFKNISEANEFLQGGELSWMDETSLLEKFFEADYPRPDLIGPISRSPVKSYSEGEWRTLYPPEYFYDGKVIRLNESEEKNGTLREEFKGEDYVDKISFIRHGMDLDLTESSENERIYILWAGNPKRSAKNYQMWLEIQDKIREMGCLPSPYQFKSLLRYGIKDYMETLKETALLVNTSKYESFCCAVAEARASGSGALVKEKFNGDYVHLNQPGQTPYNVEDYAHKILDLCHNPNKLVELQKDSLKYVKENCSSLAMLEDVGDVLLEIWEEKNG